MNIVSKNRPQNTKVPYKKLTSNRRLLTVLMIVVVVVALGYGVRSVRTAAGALDKNLFQAVFLSNGQVYFGKIDKLSGDYVDMSQIYYLQTQSTDDKKTSADKVADPASSTSDVKLIKLGNELHGPTDRMLINKDQVLFWENLKEDGKVSEAIRQYESDNDK